MKKEYLKPEMMISLFDTRDVITGSGEKTGLEVGDPATISDGGAASGNISIPYGNLS